MKVEIVMPKMGESINEGTLIKWHKKKGDKVKKDEIIYEISTDKVDTEIPSPEDGVLFDIKVFEQETVEVGTVVAVIETNGDTPAEQVEEKKIETPSTTQVGGEIVDVPMPKMGESIMEGTIIKWHKKVGDSIKKDETLFEISTDKVDSEIPSPVDGTLTEILYPEGETVNVGKVVAYVESNSNIEIGKEEILNEVINSEEEKNTTVDGVKENLNNKLNEGSNQENVIEIPMPKMGESITEGTLIKWYKQVGDKVKKDETIFEISTDKVDTEVPSPADGILKEILVKEQETVSVGTIVAKLISSSESIAHQSMTENVFPLKIGRASCRERV